MSCCCKSEYVCRPYLKTCYRKEEIKYRPVCVPEVGYKTVCVPQQVPEVRYKKVCVPEADYQPPVAAPQPAVGVADCICSLPMLVILILIVLQFSRHGKTTCCEEDVQDDCCCEDRFAPVGNGILFIIALFFLACVGCGRGFFGAGHPAY
jgi:hypothetical protein